MTVNNGGISGRHDVFDLRKMLFELFSCPVTFIAIYPEYKVPKYDDFVTFFLKYSKIFIISQNLLCLIFFF